MPTTTFPFPATVELASSEVIRTLGLLEAFGDVLAETAGSSGDVFYELLPDLARALYGGDESDSATDGIGALIFAERDEVKPKLRRLVAQAWAEGAA